MRDRPEWGRGFWKAKIRDDGWVSLETLNLPTSFQKRKEAVRELKRNEEEMIKVGLLGWIAGCKIEDYKMIKLLDGLGAKEYFCDGTDIIFFKELNHGGKNNEHAKL